MSKFERKLRKIVEQAVKQQGSVNRVAKSCDVPQPSLNDWLNGKGGLTLSTLGKLCDGLKIEPKS